MKKSFSELSGATLAFSLTVLSSASAEQINQTCKYEHQSRPYTLVLDTGKSSFTFDWEWQIAEVTHQYISAWRALDNSTGSLLNSGIASLVFDRQYGSGAVSSLTIDGRTETTKFSCERS